MNTKLCLLLFFTCLIRFSSQDEEKKYTAAVLELEPPYSQQNALFFYTSHIEYVSLSFRADIVVFPEGTLTLKEASASAVPDPQEKIIPYKNNTYSNVLREMSKAAAKSKIYVVVNMYERVDCTDSDSDCPEKGYFLYNTNVAFDREGMVVARYRKINVYDEGTVDRPKTKELSTFTTDFGVTFGLFTCFDILFKTPAFDLVNEKNVRHFVFPSQWYGELPFLTAVQIQAGWSYSNNVTLLASGVNRPTKGSSGTGIYLGRQRMHSVMYEREGTVIIYDGIKRNEQIQNFRQTSRKVPGLKLLEDPSVSSAEKKQLDLSAKNFKGKVCHNEFCCNFDIAYRESHKENKEDYAYNVLAFQGERRFGKNFTHDVAYCAVVLCSRGNCAKKPPNAKFPIIFEKIEIEAEFEGRNNFQMPTTLVAKKDEEEISFFHTMSYDSYTFNKRTVEGSDKYLTKMELLQKNVPNIFSFGIFGRKFD